MYRMEQQTYRRIVGVKRVAFCMLILPVLFLSEIKAQKTSYTKAESFLFSFVEDKDLFLADYGDNAFELQRMNEILTLSRVKLLENTWHLLVVAHINPYNADNEVAINEASLRASRIRAYLKSKLNIPHECIAFYIDRSGEYKDQVHVYQVHAPLPWFANQEISCSESRYPNAIVSAIARYGAVPFVNLYSRGSSEGCEREVYVITDPLFDRSELEDYRLSISVTIPEKTTTVSKKIYVKKTPAEQVAVKEVPTEEMQANESNPVTVSVRPSVSRGVGTPIYMSVKTNLLPWFTVAPSVSLGTGDVKLQTGSFMPNAEVECYFAERWSVAVAGMYSDFAYKDKTRDRWAVSEFSVEPRVWPLKPGEFTWLNTGLFGEYGDFDVQGSGIDPDKDILYGRTGRFWTVGASIGCLFPLGKGFCAEASLRTGYRSVFDGKKYRYDKIDDTNYLESRFTSTGFMIGLKVNLVYRFQIR